ncbi:MAG TPA: hypothetical protein PLX20_15965 [Rhodocyclaceae bacterium]|nr:hypothetical protein [Rhodocyclaceae bacterium]HMV55388.1 hypothetical protein [Rhodocyclaceae bacterium]HNA04526.1 hypothetical protein [Rhodocyclaceae bacterium]HNB80188.1 hypothetical protein [Rhodocyclaceae bacterium]HNC62721.1 hypothetical protein [Rhodocyclaceae bacterium]
MSSAIPARRQSGWVVWLLVVVLVVGVLFAGYTWTVLSWSYSQGERAGYVQKFSRKGWICKTWEGELAMVTMPGTLADKFEFSVRDDVVAAKINETMGRRVSLAYDQHIGVPTSCFGETQHFVKGVKPVEALEYQTPPGTQPAVPVAPAAAPAGK